jgi:hypothetical protein
MRIFKDKKSQTAPVQYLKALAEQAREQRIRYQRPAQMS